MASNSEQSIFQHKTFCLITGASKGLGRCMAVEFGAQFPLGSVMVLIARDAVKLEETKQMVKDVSSSIDVHCVAMDLGQQNEDNFSNLLSKLLCDMQSSAQDYDQALIVHNAASLGPVNKNFTELGNWKEVSEYFDLNLTSVVTLNSAFLRQFKTSSVSHKTVINITSICALQPFKSWSLYCAGKAARDMLFRTMAAEDSSVRVLNYAPGPIDTDMQVEARTVTADKELKDMFVDMKENNKLLTCEDSVSRLVKLLKQNTYDSGAHIDYYDL